MDRPGDRLWWIDALLRLILGAGLTTFTGYLFWGPNAFARGDAFWFVTIGVGCSLIYVVCNHWGARLGGATSMLLSMMAAALASQYRVAVWSQTLTMMLLVVLLHYVLVTGKIERPRIGRLLLLGPLFALGSLVLTMTFRVVFFREVIVEASINNALHYFKIGSGLGIGLELAELIIPRWRRVIEPATEETRQS